MNSDRYFLTIYSDLDQVGIYSLAYKLGMFGVSLLMDPFAKVWSPFLFEYYNKKEGPALISKVITLFTMFSVSIGLGISITSPWVLPLISSEAYHTAYKIIPLICLASIFYSLSSLADAGILISKKTQYKPFIFAVASGVAVLFNFILVPIYKSTGAAMTLTITFLSILVINFIISNKFYVIKIEYKKVIIIFVSAILTYIISNSLILYFNDILHKAIISILCFMLFLLLLWFGNLFNKSEKEYLINVIKNRTLSEIKKR
jgi:O-antigen/teichoic acid export membrane protein